LGLGPWGLGFGIWGFAIFSSYNHNFITLVTAITVRHPNFITLFPIASLLAK
jgi:hypothetical protein